MPAKSRRSPYIYGTVGPKASSKRCTQFDCSVRSRASPMLLVVHWGYADCSAYGPITGAGAQVRHGALRMQGAHVACPPA